MIYSFGYHSYGVPVTLEVTCACNREYEREKIKDQTALQQARNVQRVCMRQNKHDEKGK